MPDSLFVKYSLKNNKKSQTSFLLQPAIFSAQLVQYCGIVIARDHLYRVQQFSICTRGFIRKLHVCNEKPAHGSTCLNCRRRIEKTTNHMFDLPSRTVFGIGLPSFVLFVVIIISRDTYSSLALIEDSIAFDYLV